MVRWNCVDRIRGQESGILHFLVSLKSIQCKRQNLLARNKSQRNQIKVLNCYMCLIAKSSSARNWYRDLHVKENHVLVRSLIRRSKPQFGNWCGEGAVVMNLKLGCYGPGLWRACQTALSSDLIYVAIVGSICFPDRRIQPSISFMTRYKGLWHLARYTRRSWIRKQTD